MSIYKNTWLCVNVAELRHKKRNSWLNVTALESNYSSKIVPVFIVMRNMSPSVPQCGSLMRFK